MVNWRASTPKLEAVADSTVDRNSLSAIVTFEHTQTRQLDVVFSASIIPATIGVLAARLDEIVGDLDDPDLPEMQTLQASRLQIAMNEKGQIALLIGLQGVGEFPILLDRELLATLKTEIEEVLAATDRRRRN